MSYGNSSTRLALRNAFSASLLAFALFSSGCATQDIPQAHRGRMFYRTGPFALFMGGKGLSGPVLNPGTHFTGTYNEISMVDCSITTMKESLDTLTRDGVHFGFDISVRFAADCSDKSVQTLLATVSPDKGSTISTRYLYETFIRPGIGESVREVVSPIRANELNEKQATIMAKIRDEFLQIMRTRETQIVKVYEVNLSHLDFPDAMDAANVQRAVQSVLRDKAIAERERLQAEVETMTGRQQLAQKEADVRAIEIERIGEALRRYPEYMQYDLQSKMPEIYRQAGQSGNLVITAPSPSVLVTPKGAPKGALPPPAQPSHRPTPAGAPNSP
jgi:hypothetical protein